MPTTLALALLAALLPLHAWQDPKPKLKLVIIEGDGAVNNVRQRVAREPIVEVRDENDRPIAGAVVVFTLPARGASGSFVNGSRIATIVTDANGRAAAGVIQPNAASGSMQINVTASYQGQTASSSITQTNSAAAASGGVSATTIGIIAGVAAAAGIGLAVGLKGGDKSPGTSPVVTPPVPAALRIRIGAPIVIGPPR